MLCEKRSVDMALVICPFWGVNMPPLGVSSIVSNLEARGLRIGVADFNIECFRRAGLNLQKFWTMDFSECWDDFSLFCKIRGLLDEHINYCVERTLSFNCKVIGLSVFASNRFFSIEVIKGIRQIAPEKIVIVGGRGVVTAHERNIFPGDTVNYFFIGEGEQSIIPFLGAIKNNEPVPEGIGFVRYEDRMRQANIYIIQDLNELLSPTYREFDLSKYQEKVLPIIISRGCISHCAFCDDWRLSGLYRFRKAEVVFKEIEYYVKNYGITNFLFFDLSVNANPRELKRLCDYIIESNLKITWVASAIPAKWMNLGLFKKMSQAGCFTLVYGIESGSSKVLKLMNKLFTPEEAAQVMEDTHEAGINVQINLITGFPGEGDDEFRQTVEFIRKNRENISGITNLNACNVTRGSTLFLKAKELGISFPENPVLHDSRWNIGDINTYQIRQARAIELMGLVKDLNLAIFTSNVFAKDQDKTDEKVYSVGKE